MGDDPELIATFWAEVQERLASLQSGLLELEGHPAPRQVVAGLFRDAHTVKGSARMLGLTGVLGVSHAMEDLLGVVRDGRMAVRRDLVDLLLASCDGIGRALPGGELDADDLSPLITALAAAVGGREPVEVAPLPGKGTTPVPEPAVAVPLPSPPVPMPLPPPAPTLPAPAAEPTRGPSNDSVRVVAAKVYDLLDAVGEADLGARRVEQTTAGLLRLAAEQSRWNSALRTAAASSDGLSPEVAFALHRLVGAGE